MKANFRQLFAYYIDITTQNKGAVLPPLADLVDIWDRRRRDGHAHSQISNGDVDLTLGDVVSEPGEQFAALLIRHSDKLAADSVYSDIRADSFTAHAKAQGEGGETGVHIFLSTAPERGLPNRYFCVIERVPNLDITMIRRFLNRLLHDEYDSDQSFHTFPNPMGQRNRQGEIRLDRCLPRLEFEGVPSQNLANDVQNGRLTGVTLIRAETAGAVGGVAFLNKKESVLKLGIDQGSLTANIWADLRRAIAAEAPNYPVAQIALKLPNRNKTASVKINSATGAPLSDLYIRSFDVTNIFPPMAHSSRVVVPALLQRAVATLLQARSI